MLNRSASLAMSTCVLKALPGKLDIKRHSPSILYLLVLGFQFGPSSVQTVDSAALTWHRMTEAYKHAFAERTKLGDPATGTSSFKHYIKQVTS